MADAKPSALDAGTVKIGSFTAHRLGLGTNRIAGAEMADVTRLLEGAIRLGVNFIDTADIYGATESENRIHKVLYPYEGLIIATKGGLRVSGGTMQPDGSPEYLRQACAASLKRLELERITLYQLHRPDPEVPIEESVQALVDLQKEGKIRHIGLSNVTLEQLQQALKLTPIATVQNHYNFVVRKDSEDVLRFCEQQGITFIPYFPLGNAAGGSARVLHYIAGKHSVRPHQIALAWLLAHSPVILPIPGTTSLKHLEENIAAASIKLDEEDMDALDKLSD